MLNMQDKTVEDLEVQNFHKQDALGRIMYNWNKIKLF